MKLSRRDFLVAAGAGAGAAAVGLGGRAALAPPESEAATSWEDVHRLFELDPRRVHLAGMLFATHPRPVREAIERYRRELDADPVTPMRRERKARDARVRKAAAAYLGARSEDLAFTDSTTMGLGLVFGNLVLRPGDEVLTTEHDHYACHHALALRAERDGVPIRRVRLYDDPARATADEVVARLLQAVGPRTRVVAVTWVHSCSGVKLPLARIGRELAERNRGRAPEKRALLVVDAVHALGVEDFTVDALGCDFLIAGTHKWLLGPRGTGLIWAHPRAHSALRESIPSFSRGVGWGGAQTPGGFHAFEHRWALAEAFDFQQALGKRRVADHVHGLSRHFKEGLAGSKRVRLRTPLSEELSSGINCFEVSGLRPNRVVKELFARGIVTSDSPYRPSYVRVTPAIYNTAEDVERALEAVRSL